MGHVSLVYTDDDICGAADRVSAKAARLIQKKDLALSGLKVNASKSVWEPRQIGEWLGFIINTIRMVYQVPPKKIESLKRKITSILYSCNVCIKDIARIAGYIVSMTIAIGSIARLFTKQMYHTTTQRNSWSDYVSISEPLRQELKFGLQHVDAFNGYAIQRKFSATAIVYSDASDTGFGGFSAVVGNNTSFGHWSQYEAGQSSTYREMKAILYILKSFASILQHH